MKHKVVPGKRYIYITSNDKTTEQLSI